MWRSHSKNCWSGCVHRCTPIFWCGQHVHSTKVGVHSCALQPKGNQKWFWSAYFVHSKNIGVPICALHFLFLFFFGVDKCPLQFSWSGQLSTPKKIGIETFPLQNEAHVVKFWSANSLTQSFALLREQILCIPFFNMLMFSRFFNFFENSFKKKRPTSAQGKTGCLCRKTGFFLLKTNENW